MGFGRTPDPPAYEIDGPAREGEQESRSVRMPRRPSVVVMTTLQSITLDVTDPTASRAFLVAAFALDHQIGVRAADAPSTGFRGFTLSLVVAQPAIVDSLVGTALAAGATTLKAPAKSFWGYGAVVQAPDGTIWKLASSAKKNTTSETRAIDQIALLLGVEDVKATKRFYVERGLEVAKSYGGKYVEFATPGSPVTLALYGRRHLAKDAGVPVDGSGSHRISLVTDGDGFTDPDGFAWETAASNVVTG